MILQCPRCKDTGLFEQRNYYQGDVAEGLSCLKCGEHIDPTILRNWAERTQRDKRHRGSGLLHEAQ